MLVMLCDEVFEGLVKGFVFCMFEGLGIILCGEVVVEVKLLD